MKIKLPALPLLGFLFSLLLSSSALAQTTTVYTDGDSSSAQPGLWTDDLNWSANSPTTIGSSAVVQIGTVPQNSPNSQGQGTITILVGGLAPITSLTFNSSLNATVALESAGDTLAVSGTIANLSTSNQVIGLQVQNNLSGAQVPTWTAPTSIVAGAAGITFSDLSIAASTVHASGVLDISELDITLTSTNTYGNISNTGTIAFANGATVSITDNNYAANAKLGDTFDVLTGAITGSVTLTNLPTLSGTLVWKTSQFDTNGELIVTSPATQSFTNPTPSVLNIIAGSSTTVSGTLSDTAPTGANDLAVNLADNGGTGGTVAGLIAASGSFVTANTSTTVTGTFTAGTAGQGQTWSISNTDPNASGTFVSITGTVNVYNHAGGVLAITSPTAVEAIASTTVSSTLTLTNSGANNVNLVVGTNSLGLTGSLVANGTSASVTGSLTAGAAGTTTTGSFTTQYGDDQSVLGHNALNSQTATSGTITITNLNYSDGVLAITSPSSVKAIAGTTVTSTLTLTNSGANNANLVIGTNSLGLTGSLVANGTSASVTGSLTAGAAGTTTTGSFSTLYGDDQSVLNGHALNSQTATSGTITITNLNYSDGVLAITSPSSVKAIAGTTVTSTLTLTNSGANNANLVIGTNSLGLTGSLVANGTSASVTGSLTAGAAGTTTTGSFSTLYGDDQSVLNGHALNSQTATSGTITITNLNYSDGVLAVTGPTSVKAIASTTVTSTLTLTNSGADNANLVIGTNNLGLTGTLVANGTSASVTGSVTAGAAGTTTTGSFTTLYGDDQSVLNGHALNSQTATGTITITNLNYSNGVLAITSPTAVKAIASTTVTSTLTLTNSGANNANLVIGTNSLGLTGSLVANGTSASVTGSLTAGAAGTTTTGSFTTLYGDDQSVINGHALNSQTATSGTITITNLNYSDGVLAITSPTSVKAIASTTVTSTLTLTNSGANNANLVIGTNSLGLTGSLVANGTSSNATGSLTAGAAGTTTTGSFTTLYGDDQSVLNGHALNSQTATSGTITITNLNYSDGVLTVTSPTSVKAIANTTVTSTLTLTNSGANNANLVIGTNNLGLTGSLVANGTSASVTGSVTAGAAGTTTTGSFTTQYGDDQSVLNGHALNSQTATGTITITNLNYSNGVLAITSPTTVKAITGATVTSTLTLTNSGANNANLVIGTNNLGLTGSLVANGTSSSVTGSLTAGAAGTTTTGSFTTLYGDDQSVLNGHALNSQTATSGTITIENYNHSVASFSSTTTVTSTSTSIGNVHQGSSAIGATPTSVTLYNLAGTNADLQITNLGGLTTQDSETITAGSGSVLNASTSGTQTLGTNNTNYVVQTADGSNFVGGTANSPLTYTVTSQVYSGKGTWAGGSSTWGASTSASDFGTNWQATNGSPGLDANYTTTDTATFTNTGLANGGDGVTTVNINGVSPSLSSISFNTTGTGSYTITGSGTNSLKLNGGSNLATINDLSGSQTLNVPLELDTDTVATVTGTADKLNISGSLSGVGTLTTAGAGTVFLAGGANFTGTTAISGTLQLGANGELNNSSQVTINGGTLDLNGNNTTVTDLSGTGGTITTSTGSATLTIYEPADPLVSSSITGALAVNATGPGVLQLSGNNSYTGGTTINADSTIQVGSSTALGTGSVTNNGILATFNNYHVINVGAPGTSVASYTQTSTGNLSLTINSAPVAGNTNDMLFVNGQAALNGGLTLTFQPGGGYAPKNGDSYLIVTATGGITALGAGFTKPTVVDAGALGLTVTISESANTDNLFANIGQVQQLPFASLPIAYTHNQLAVAQYVDAYDSVVTTGPFTAVVTALDNVSTNPTALTRAFDQLTPADFVNFGRTTIFNNASFTTQEMDGYLAGLRSPQGNFLETADTVDSHGFSISDPTVDPGLASMRGQLLAWNPAPLGHGLLSDSSGSILGGVDMKQMKSTDATLAPGDPWNVFVSGNAIWAQDSPQAGSSIAQSNSTTAAMQVGINFRITPHLRTGVSFGFAHTQANLNVFGSNATLDSYAPGVFLSYADGGWYGNGLASYGFNNFNQYRYVSFGGLSGIAQSAPNGGQVVGDVDGGYDFHFKNLTVGPTAGLQYTHYTIDSYSETGAAAFDLNVNQQESESLRSRLGGHVSYDYPIGKILLTPHLDASWQHEFLDQSQSVTSQFNSVGAGSFTILTPNPSTDSALLDAGVNGDLNKRASLFLDYLVQVGQSNYFGQSVQGGVKISF